MANHYGKRNKTLWDIPLLNNNPIQDGNVSLRWVRLHHTAFLLIIFLYSLSCLRNQSGMWSSLGLSHAWYTFPIRVNTHVCVCACEHTAMSTHHNELTLYSRKLGWSRLTKMEGMHTNIYMQEVMSEGVHAKSA